MTTYDPALDREKISQEIKTIFQTLRDKLGNGVTLKNVTDKFNEIFGLGWSEKDVGKYLTESLEGKRQGTTKLAERAHATSDAAADASRDAAEQGTVAAHARASVFHRDAAAGLRDAASFHDRAARFHDEKAAGRVSSEITEGCE